MELTIGNHQITSDPMNIIVKRRVVAERGPKAGEEYWSSPTYHSNIQQACQTILREDVSAADASSIGQLIHAIEHAERSVCEAVREAIGAGIGKESRGA